MPERSARAAEPAGEPGAIVDPRILQANERTLLAWVRTAVGLMAFGFVVARMGLWLRQLEGLESGRAGVSVFLGTGIVALGGCVSGAAALRFRRLRAGLLRGEFRPGSPSLELATGLGVAAVALILSAYLLSR